MSRNGNAGSTAGYPNLTAAFERRGRRDGRIRKTLGENWVRVLKGVRGA